MKLFRFIKKSRKRRAAIDQSVHPVPPEISLPLVPSVVVDKVPLPNKSKDSEEFGYERLLSVSTQSTAPNTVVTAYSRDEDNTVISDGWSKYSLGCRDTRGVKHCLWKATSSSRGLISHVDDLCREQIIYMMSRPEAARKKILDDILNHGEF